jgi:hypothetical protein
MLDQNLTEITKKYAETIQQQKQASLKETKAGTVSFSAETKKFQILFM